MSKLVSVLSALALAIGVGSPAVAEDFASQSQLTQKLSNFSEGCELEALTGIEQPSCLDETFLVSFSSEAARGFTEYYETDSLEASFQLITTSAFDLSARELSELVRRPGVVEVSPNLDVELTGTQSSPPWHLDRLDQAALPLNSSYSFVDGERGAGVAIYVVDTGVNIGHVEFTGRITRGYSAIGTSTDYNDCNGHGSHVAGLAAGTITGPAKLAEVVPVRVLDCDGSGTLLGVLLGLDWVARNTQVGQPAVVNMSLGGDRNTYLDNAVANLSAQGLVFVVAAGNTGTDACQVSPAAVPAAITVAASDQNDVFASYSNRGSCVDVIAPGSDVRSAWIGASNTAAIASGTSMAAGVVSGIVATQMSYGHQAPAALQSALISTGRSGVITSVPAATANILVSNTVAFNSGGTSSGSNLGNVGTNPTENDTVSVDPITQPTNPTNPTATVPATIAKPTVEIVDSNAVVSWVLPVDGGSPILSQVLQVFSGSTKLNELTLNGTQTSFMLTGLSPGVAYKVSIAAVNAIGSGIYSPLSDAFGLEVNTQLNGPEGGDFSAWVKRISPTQAKFYAKFPQLNQKIQFQWQLGTRAYKEIGWVRITSARIDANGEYIGLTNGVYFVRTVNLQPGKNRLRIIVDGKQLGTTKTFSR